MAIVIKEIILSDNLEKFMEKVNFNFDQLLLAGGGPPGPQGIQGLIGPAGPQGGRGNYWDVGSTASESAMEIAIGGSLINGDLFLADGTDPLDPAGTKGQIYSWNDTLTQFDDTGLNLVGPPGPTGSAGANLGWNVYAGITTLNEIIWPFDNGVVGLTANFHFLKGDTEDLYGSGVVNAGVTAGRSRDTLWLGGYNPAFTMSADTFFTKLDYLPKLFISPRIPLDSSSAGATTSGVVGSGITIGIEDEGSDGYPNKNSFSNIVVDTDLNLRITNFSNFINAAGFGTTQNIISIESQRATQILAGGFFKGSGDPLGDSLQSIQIGTGLTGQANPISSANLNGIVIKTSDTDTSDQVVQIELKQQDIFRVFKNNLSVDHPTMLIDGHGGIGIVIAPEKVTDIVAAGASYGRLFAYSRSDYGSALTGTIDTIALGSWSNDNTSNQVTLTAIDQKIHIGYGSQIAMADQSLYDLSKHSLNVMGDIRMAGGTAGAFTPVTAPGNIIKSADQWGKMEWSDLNISDIVTGDGTENRLAYWNVTNESISDTVSGTYDLQWNPDNNGLIGLQYNTSGDSTGQFLKSVDADGSAEWADGDSSKITEYLIAGSFTHDVDPRTKSVSILCIGGGGGGGGGGCNQFGDSSANDFAYSGGGGQGGGMSINHFIEAADISNTPWDVIVGDGGAGGGGGVGNPFVGGLHTGGAGAPGGDSFVRRQFQSANDAMCWAQGGYGGGRGWSSLDAGSAGAPEAKDFVYAGAPGGNLGGRGTEVNRNKYMTSLFFDSAGQDYAFPYNPTFYKIPYNDPSLSQLAQDYWPENHGGGFNVIALGFNKLFSTNLLAYNSGGTTTGCPSGGGMGGMKLPVSLQSLTGTPAITQFWVNGSPNTQLSAGLGGEVTGVKNGIAGQFNNYAGRGGNGTSPAQNSSLPEPQGNDGNLYGGGGGGGSARNQGVTGSPIPVLLGGGGGDGARGCVVIIEHF